MVEMMMTMMMMMMMNTFRSGWPRVDRVAPRDLLDRRLMLTRGCLLSSSVTTVIVIIQTGEIDGIVRRETDVRGVDRVGPFRTY